MLENAYNNNNHNNITINDRLNNIENNYQTSLSSLSSLSSSSSLLSKERNDNVVQLKQLNNKILLLEEYIKGIHHH